MWPAEDVVHLWRIRRGRVRLVLAGYLGLPPDRLRTYVGRWGKPGLVGDPLRFNLSHAGGVTLLAVTGSRAVGVDVAHVRPDFPAAAVAARYFTRPERDLVAAAGADVLSAWSWIWARKEAVVKAAGGRLMLGVGLDVRGLVVTDPSDRLGGPWRLHDVPVSPRYAACVALSGADPFEISWRGRAGTPA